MNIKAIGLRIGDFGGDCQHEHTTLQSILPELQEYTEYLGMHTWALTICDTCGDEIKEAITMPKEFYEATE